MSFWVAGSIAVAGILGDSFMKGKGAKAQAKAARNAFDYQSLKSEQAVDQLRPYSETGAAAHNAYARAMGLPQYNEMNSKYERSGRIGKNYSGIQTVYMEILGREATGAELKKYRKSTYENLISDIRASGEYQQAYRAGILPDRETGKLQEQAVDPDQYGGFKESPGYQFRKDEGTRALDRSAASRGLLLSGAQNKALTRYGQDVASEEFQNYLGNLGYLSQSGQNAAGGIANVYTGAGQQGGNQMMEQGQARASGYINKGNTIASIANVFSGGYAGMLNNVAKGANASATDEAKMRRMSGYTLQGGL